MASVERRSGKRGDSYVVRYRDTEGRQRSKSFSDRKSALLFSNKVETQLADGEWIDPTKGRTKFADFHTRWTAARVVSPSRSATEASQARCHILPRWGGVPLNRIRPLDVDAWLKDSPAGPHTKVMVLAQFKLCLDAAVREGLIRSNPAAATKAPSLPRKRVTRDDVLDADELTRLVAATPERYKALVYLSGWLGWRWSEAMGLQLRHLDFERECIYVGERTVVESAGVLHVRAGGKTDAATRTVPLPTPALGVLRWHVDAPFTGSGPDGSVFVTEDGHTPFRSNFRRVFLKAVADAGLEGRGINMRQLRHTAASLMLSSGLDILDVQERLGHARGSVTLDIYGRVLSSRRSVGTDRMGAVMGAYTFLTQDVGSGAASETTTIGAETAQKAS